MKEADVVDRQVAREKRRELKRKRKEREREVSARVWVCLWSLFRVSVWVSGVFGGLLVPRSRHGDGVLLACADLTTDLVTPRCQPHASHVARRLILRACTRRVCAARLGIVTLRGGPQA